VTKSEISSKVATFPIDNICLGSALGVLGFSSGLPLELRKWFLF